ncbi:MAG TPA: sensor domain-containing diguanylate cyclase [Thermoanaerobaculia bacterium]|nr:sensor domain-containing diguanylate cyclase [Thermoanaerobaculia bacterium]
MRVVTIPADEIARLLDRQRRLLTSPEEAPLPELFEEILGIANQFVPSESGSVLIDDPRLKVTNRWQPDSNELVFVACFGEKADQLVGRRMRASDGIVGKVYLTGEAILSPEAQRHASFFPGIDREVGYTTNSVVCVPIRMGSSTCGVLELINRRGRGSFDESELELLRIFAGYISTSLQNVLDAARYRELAKRDDLSGLYNDRFFNEHLSDEVERVERQGGDLCLIFLDLDHFKAVNDRHGHLVGSQTLREIGLTLSRVASSETSTVARYGGDEFVVIISHCGMSGGLEVGERIRRAIAETQFEIDAGPAGRVVLAPGTVTASLGVASYRELEFPEELPLHYRKNEFIRAADQAMYDAKASGKNRISTGVKRDIRRQTRA